MSQNAQPDPRADDVTSAFMTFCVSSFASSVGAHALLDGHPDIARPLDSAGLNPFLGPATTPREGWLHKTSHNAWLALAYVQLGHGGCEIVVREADATSLKAALIRAVDNYARLTKAKLDTKPPRQEIMNGSSTETIAWEMTLPDTHRTAIIASVSDHAANGKQALLSFAVEH